MVSSLLLITMTQIKNRNLAEFGYYLIFNNQQKKLEKLDPKFVKSHAVRMRRGLIIIVNYGDNIYVCLTLPARQD